MTQTSDQRKPRKIRMGFVVSSKMDKTVVVEVSRTVLEPTYKKYIRQRKRFMAHDETNRCRVGDKVMIIETRPLSRNKNWRVTKVIKAASLPGGSQ